MKLFLLLFSLLGFAAQAQEPIEAKAARLFIRRIVPQLDTNYFSHHLSTIYFDGRVTGRYSEWPGGHMYKDRHGTQTSHYLNVRKSRWSDRRKRRRQHTYFRRYHRYTGLFSWYDTVRSFRIPVAAGYSQTAPGLHSYNLTLQKANENTRYYLVELHLHGPAGDYPVIMLFRKRGHHLVDWWYILPRMH